MLIICSKVTVEEFYSCKADLVTMLYGNNLYKKEYDKELQRFEALFNFASIGIIVTNRQGGIVLIKDKSCVRQGDV